MAGPHDSWDSADNAKAYAEFARAYPTYRQTSRDLVSLARLAADAAVVDLACGTGVTTEAVLAVLGERGRVAAVDASQAMLAAARSRIGDRRVTWLWASAEHFSERVPGGVDAVVCNSAIWQTDVLATAAQAHRALRPGGRFIFNLAMAMLADHADAHRSSDPLIELMTDIAAQEHGWVAGPPASADVAGQELSENWLRRVLGTAGLQVEQVRVFRYQSGLEEQRAWLSIPVFTARRFGGLSYEQRMTILDRAYRQLAGNHHEPATTNWVAFVARRDGQTR